MSKLTDAHKAHPQFHAVTNVASDALIAAADVFSITDDDLDGINGDSQVDDLVDDMVIAILTAIDAKASGPTA